jgi:hypothetical protein
MGFLKKKLDSLGTESRLNSERLTKIQSSRRLKKMKTKSNLSFPDTFINFFPQSTSLKENQKCFFSYY